MFCEKHLQALTRVCRRCGERALEKSKKNLTATLQERCAKFWNLDVALDDSHWHPSVLCATCAMHLQRLAAGQVVKTTICQKEWSVKLSTRGRVCKDATCEICVIAFSPPGATTHLRGRPRELQENEEYKLCSKCFARIGQGRPHPCNKRTAVNEAVASLKRRRLAEPVAARVLHDVIDEGKSVIQTLAHPLPFSLSNTKATMDVSALKEVKNAGGGLSNKCVKDVTRVLRARGVVVAPLNHLRAQQETLLGPLFSIMRLPLNLSKEKLVKDVRPTDVCICTDVVALIKLCHPEVSQPAMKIGCDFGGHFLKVTMQLLQHDTANSVSRLQLLAVVQAPESHENLKLLFDQLKFSALRQLPAVKITCVGDLKVEHLLMGIMQGKFPCVYCKWEHTSGFEGECLPRTYADHLSLYQKLQEEHGGNSKYAIKCDGVEALPVAPYDNPLDFVAPPGLHLLLGVFHKLYDAMKAKMRARQLQLHEAALKKHCIFRSEYFGGSFEGNQVRKILKLLDSLHMLPGPELSALRELNRVVVACFGMHREADYQKRIADFIDAYKRTKLSVTLKVHVLAKHVVDYLETRSEANMGLAFYSEQATESSHSKYKRAWKRFKTNVDNPLYGERLLNCVKDFNFQRFLFFKAIELRGISMSCVACVSSSARADPLCSSSAVLDCPLVSSISVSS
eukprot:Pompholyxophrys_punicea_v1_NODE_178_length_2994_cov_7.487581.p1 type:complete len:680 gc:universal NODE_178_length_2994_cov_7.487581:2498-459(-)